MSDPLQQNPRDLGVVFVPNESPSSLRVPTAEEASLAERIQLTNAHKSRLKKGWIKPPELSVIAPRTVSIRGEVLSPLAADYQLQIDTEIELPTISSAGLVRQFSYLSLANLVVEVGADQDPVLGQFSYQYLVGAPPNQTLSTITQENTRRLRSFWMIVASSTELTVETFTATLPLDVDENPIIVAQSSSSGFALGHLVAYTLDPGWTAGSPYKVFTELVDIQPICRILRQQQYAENGYTWGIVGEDDLEGPFAIQRSLSQDVSARDLTVRLRELAVGQPGPQTSFKRTVQNLVAGAAAGNPGREGVSAASPNGSTALANDQRIFFLGEARLQVLGADLVTAANDGSGRPEVSTPLNTQSPLGSSFSQERTDHKIYTLAGQEESAFGTFTNLGGTGTLTWRGGSNTTIQPGQQVFFVPAIQYPSGSGFSIPFSEAEAAWLNAAAIPSANIRLGPVDDLEGYEDPGGSDYFVVLAPERAGLLYIYRRYQVTTDSNGVALAPATAKGCFAFIEGVAGRIDAPVKTGLAPSTTYNALLYYTPKINETWQFQLKYCQYQGTKETAFLDGGTIVSEPIAFINVQGAGNFIYQGAGSTQFIPISMHLPQAGGEHRPDSLYGPIFLSGSSTPTWFQEVVPSPASGMTLPHIGQTLTFSSLPGAYAKSVSGRLLVGGQLVGFRGPELQQDGKFQSILAFLVEKANQRRMVVATAISDQGKGGEPLALDTSTGTGIDVFAL